MVSDNFNAIRATKCDDGFSMLNCSETDANPDKLVEKIRKIALHFKEDAMCCRVCQCCMARIAPPESLTKSDGTGMGYQCLFEMIQVGRMSED